MLSLKNTIRQAFVWVVVLMIPVQSLPAATCACGPSSSCCSESASGESSCCSAEKQVGTTDSCCSTTPCCSTTENGSSSGCQCGIHCQCGQDEQPSPSTPPVESNAAEKLANASLWTVSVTILYQPHVTQRRNDSSAAADSLAALDRCVSLCRFTL